MMDKTIKYICFYDRQDSNISRCYATSAVNKIDYIIQSIEKTGYKVELISTSFVNERRFKLYKSEKKSISDQTVLFLPPSFGGSGKIVSKLRVLWNLFYLFVYLLLHTRKNEIVIVYHSLGYFNTILWAKKIRKFKLIFEVEEIYQDVSVKGNYLRKLEYKMFDLADAYFFSTELLDRKLNVLNKPSVISYGTYKQEPVVSDKFNDGKIHVVYAGTFDIRKGGATIAVMSAEFLPQNYHLHVCGFGNENEINYLKKVIADTAEKSKAFISYEGLLKGHEYVQFIQKCHIGLSTQNPEAAFNDTSFPSKVLSYMSNGLSVVSIRIKAITSSAISPYICYYDEQSPEQIAAAIIQAKIINNNREGIARLDADFLLQLERVFGNF